MPPPLPEPAMPRPSLAERLVNVRRVCARVSAAAEHSDVAALALALDELAAVEQERLERQAAEEEQARRERRARGEPA